GAPLLPGLLFCALTSCKKSTIALARLVHGEAPTAEVGAVEGLDGPLGLVGRRHLHEAEAPRTPGLAIRHDLCPGHRPVAGEGLLELLGGRAVRQIPDVDVRIRHFSSSMTVTLLGTPASPVPLQGRTGGDIHPTDRG